ncbi:acetyl-CoA acetyltransferase [Fulvitalea axinellae]|uniref:acetyl-CoA C-acetyltransferase n=1 Tax=Fulvitalea axinellae TaxID=1182444 RepID=A0AAU9CLX1_9BACT|nr:acetyl-CoA acetyltransferase [Fulvitalea axinellae]
MKEVFIVKALRTPIGSFMGGLSHLSATELGSLAIKAVLGEDGALAPEVDEVYMGNVISANLGQAPARQASLGAGISHDVPCTTINKVCASGMKAVMTGAQSIMCGMADVVVAGGMESMSNIPYYVPNARKGYKFGGGDFVDGLVRDGLQEVYHDMPMGCCGDHLAKETGISREEQDAYAVESYRRAKEATESGLLTKEIVPVEIKPRKGDPYMMTEDEEYKNVRLEKIPNLRPAFGKEGTVTAANASTLNDGAAALLLMSAEAVERTGMKPIAKIVSFADAAHEPIWFTTAPSTALNKALDRAGKSAGDIDFYEINEAFSGVAIANNKLLSLDPEKVNVFGGAVSLGHPLGCSGARILVTLLNVLSNKDGKYGAAGICNGGGGASAMVVEKL